MYIKFILSSHLIIIGFIKWCHNLIMSLLILCIPYEIPLLEAAERLL